MCFRCVQHCEMHLVWCTVCLGGQQGLRRLRNNLIMPVQSRPTYGAGGWQHQAASMVAAGKAELIGFAVVRRVHSSAYGANRALHMLGPEWKG